MQAETFASTGALWTVLMYSQRSLVGSRVDKKNQAKFHSIPSSLGDAVIVFPSRRYLYNTLQRRSPSSKTPGKRTLWKWWRAEDWRMRMICQT